MTEGNEAVQQDTSAQSDSQPEPTRTSSDSGDSQQPMIPKGRFDQVANERKQALSRLAELESEREREAEERAKKQGEYQSLADKYKKQADTEKQKRQEIENSWTRERRLNVWSRASSGIIKSEAMVDAFSMLDDTDFQNVDEEDEAGFKRLAETLADRKPYLSDGPRGSGSGGSRNPVLGAPGSPNGNTRSTSGGGSIQPILKRRRRPSWK